MGRNGTLTKSLIVVASTFAASTLAAVPVAAHVKYTTDSDADVATLSLLVDVLSAPVNAVLLAGGGVAVAGFVLGYLLGRPLQRDIEVFRESVTQYRDMLPWLLRLSFGLSLSWGRGSPATSSARRWFRRGSWSSR